MGKENRVWTPETAQKGRMGTHKAVEHLNTNFGVLARAHDALAVEHNQLVDFMNNSTLRQLDDTTVLVAAILMLLEQKGIASKAEVQELLHATAAEQIQQRVREQRDMVAIVQKNMKEALDAAKKAAQAVEEVVGEGQAAEDGGDPQGGGEASEG